MRLLPRRNYAEMLAILVWVVVYSISPDFLKHLFVVDSSGYMQLMSMLLLFVMVGDILIMSYWRR
ncbi:hypothetical protein LB941_07710 [Ligilactobacillus sp. WILCCON 0076]|uniref:Uncharacterized protein n=1 Tax=Ligilactobacillus ubinensis TaxID=2876789 RepID=A0A9X2JLT0_9LACO|nr:hypothetical protein [Ligilactobacillus ubinensis]MCP0887219.1 hypothetical protein [Ligilactobacillus ubinensis]